MESTDCESLVYMWNRNISVANIHCPCSKTKDVLTHSDPSVVYDMLCEWQCVSQLCTYDMRIA